jgi:hypothetical protein
LELFFVRTQMYVRTQKYVDTYCIRLSSYITPNTLQVDCHSGKSECPTECEPSLQPAGCSTFCCMESSPSSQCGTAGSSASRATALNYPLEDDNPITDEDRACYAKTTRASVDRFVLLFYVSFIFACIISHQRYSFFVASVIHRSKVIADGNLSDDNNSSSSVFEVFVPPALVCQPVELRQERPSSTSTVNTNRS